jgi:hypothetical protein
MRLLANLIVALTLVWPVPLAMPTAFAAPALAPDASASQSMHGDAVHHADHEAPPPARHDSGQMADCCVGAACFSLALTEEAGVPLDLPRAQLSAGEAYHLAAISHPPDLPPPRL